MPKDFTRTQVSKESVGFWRDELKRAQDHWDHHERLMCCEELRAITSESAFGDLMPTDDESGYVDQIDSNLTLRQLDRMRSLVGDEMPEVRVRRNKSAGAAKGQDGEAMRDSELRPITVTTACDRVDTFLVGLAAIAGAPEEATESMSAYVTDGVAIEWVELTGNPTVEDASRARLSTKDEAALAAVSDEYEPGRLQDHDAVSALLKQEATSDPEGVRDQAAVHAPGEAPFEKALEAADEQTDAAEAEDAAKVPLYWRSGKFQPRVTTLYYGVNFLDDCSVTRFRDARWGARLHEMSPDEAREYPIFRKSVREDLRVAPFDDGRSMGDSPNAASVTTKAGMYPSESDVSTGVVRIWEIWDRKHRQVLWLPEEGDRFLADYPAPYVDEYGESVLPAAGPYPGFFPFYYEAPKPLTYRRSPRRKFGMPLGFPGLDTAKAFVKIQSRWVHAVKLASVAWYGIDATLFEEYQEMFRRGEGGAFPLPAKSDDSPTMEVFQWRPPPVDLYQAKNELLAQYSIDSNFPVAQLQSQPVADTATQEEIAGMSAQTDERELLRRIERVYGVTMHILMHLAFTHLRDRGTFEEILGSEDAAIVKYAWDAGWVQRFMLPEVEFAPTNTSEFTRAKQLMDLHQRAMAEIDPTTGLTTKDTEYLLDMTAKTLGFGPLPDRDVTLQEKIQRAVQIAVAGVIERMQGGGSLNADSDQGSNRDGQRRRDSDAGRGRSEPAAGRGRAQGDVRDNGKVAASTS